MDSSPWSMKDSPPFPINIYGFMKAVCERDIMGVAGLSYGIGRLAGIYGINYSNPELLFVDNSLGFAQANYVADRLSRGLLCEIWTGPNVNDMAHPTLASDCAEMLLRLAETRREWHLPLLWQPGGQSLAAGASSGGCLRF